MLGSFPPSVNETSVVHVFELVIDEEAEPEPMVPVFTLPRLIGPQQPLQLLEDGAPDPDSQRQYLAMSASDQRGAIACLEEDHGYHRIYITLTEDDLVESTGHVQTATACSSQSLSKQMQANTGQFVYTFEWRSDADPTFNLRVNVGDLAAVVFAYPDDQMPETNIGSILSYTRSAGGVEEIEIGLDVDIPNKNVDGREPEGIFFALVSHEMVDSCTILAELAAAGLVKGPPEEASPLPAALAVLQTQQVRLLGFTGSYQPHQFLLTPPLSRALAAVVLRGSTTITVDPHFLRDCRPAPGEHVYLIAVVFEDSELEIDFVYSTIDPVQRLRMRYKGTVPPPTILGAVCRPVGTYIIENATLPYGVSIDLFSPLQWTRVL